MCSISHPLAATWEGEIRVHYKLAFEVTLILNVQKSACQFFRKDSFILVKLNMAAQSSPWYDVDICMYKV